MKEDQIQPQKSLPHYWGSTSEEDYYTQQCIRSTKSYFTTVKYLQGQVEFFRSFVGLTDLEIFKIVLVYPNVMSASKQLTLQPRIEFLKDCGLDSGEIYRFLIKAPLFLALSFEKKLSHKLALQAKIGYAYRTKDLAMAMGAVSRTSSENLQEVIGLFLSYGFSCDDIIEMSKWLWDFKHSNGYGIGNGP